MNCRPRLAGDPANLERSAQLLQDMQVLWSHPGVTDEQREALVQEVFHRITIAGKELLSIEPKASYAPLFASMVTTAEYGYWEPNSPPSPPLNGIRLHSKVAESTLRPLKLRFPRLKCMSVTIAQPTMSGWDILMKQKIRSS